jgi:hypothetical protein
MFSLFTYYCSLYTDFCIRFLSFCYGVSDIFMSVFQIELNDYPHFDLAEDGRLCSMCQYCPGFPRVLYDALIRLGCDGDTPVYRCRLSTAHGMDQCEVSMTIPFDPMVPWSRSIIGSEPDTGFELMAHMALSPPCVRTASPLLQHCLSRFFQFGIRRTLYGSRVLRLCPTSWALTSTPG